MDIEARENDGVIKDLFGPEDAEEEPCALCGGEPRIDDLPHLPGKTWVCPACTESQEEKPYDPEGLTLSNTERRLVGLPPLPAAKRRSRD